MTEPVLKEKRPHQRVVMICVNDQSVEMPTRRATGLEIKQAAIEQGVSIQLDFVLSELLGDSGKTKIIGDDDLVHLHKHSRFVAIAHDDNSDDSNEIVPSVLTAIAEIKASFLGVAIVHKPDGKGGAILRIETVALGDQYVQKTTWLSCHITFQYPFADVYPLFVRPDLARKDGAPLGQGISISSFDGYPATQLSRRSNHRDPKVETAVMKILKVIQWLNEQL